MTTTDDHTIANELAAKLSGAVLQPADEGYDEARSVYNEMFADQRPALIAQCRNTDDVVATVQFARAHDIPTVVKAGGHSIAGFSVCDGGLVIDLSPMKHIDVDVDQRIARAQPGVLLGELDAATQEHGLATPLGFVSVTGIAGLTLNGGFGFLTRKHGLSCDNLVAAEVVLADGSVVRTSETERPDLLWGLRGGGGNFGIVTSFEYRLHEVTEVFMSMRFYDVSAMRTVMRAFGDITPGLPDDVVAYVTTATVPESEMFPPELHNQFKGMLLLGYVGGEDDGRTALAPLLDAVPEPQLEMAMSLPWVMAQSMQDEDMPRGRQNYWKAGNLSELSDDAIDVFMTNAASATSPFCQPGILLLGGAMARVGETDTAYCGRDATFNFSVDNMWLDPAENDEQIAWTRRFYDAMTPFLGEGVYLNFTAEETADRVRSAYGPNYERLVELKRTYDPTNFFNRNQNIRP